MGKKENDLGGHSTSLDGKGTRSVCVCVARQKGIDRPHHQFAKAKNIRGAVQVGRSISSVTKELEQVKHQRKKGGGFVLYFKKRMIFPELFPFLKRHTHTQEKSS